jgi:hypothetical protein
MQVRCGCCKKLVDEVVIVDKRKCQCGADMLMCVDCAEQNPKPIWHCNGDKSFYSFHDCIIDLSQYAKAAV